MDIDGDAVQNLRSTFNNFKISSRRSRASDEALNEAKAKYFEEMKQHFDEKTCYIVTQHDSHPGAVSFEYTYKLREKTSIGIWMDVEASIVEIAEDCEEKFIKIIHLELYSNCEEIRICNIRTRKEYRQSGHTKRLVQGVMLDLSPYFDTVSVSSKGRFQIWSAISPPKNKQGMGIRMQGTWRVPRHS